MKYKKEPISFRIQTSTDDCEVIMADWPSCKLFYWSFVNQFYCFPGSMEDLEKHRLANIHAVLARS